MKRGYVSGLEKTSALATCVMTFKVNPRMNFLGDLISMKLREANMFGFKRPYDIVIPARKEDDLAFQLLLFQLAAMRGVTRIAHIPGNRYTKLRSKNVCHYLDCKKAECHRLWCIF